MRALKLLIAVLALMTPACESIQPKTKLAVEAPANSSSLSDVKYKLEVTIN